MNDLELDRAAEAAVGALAKLATVVTDYGIARGGFLDSYERCLIAAQGMRATGPLFRAAREWARLRGLDNGLAQRIETQLTTPITEQADVLKELGRRCTALAELIRKQAIADAAAPEETP